MELEHCFKCSQPTDKRDMIEANSGDLYCDDCAQNGCFKCIEGECEVETNSGEYICSDCYSGEIDYAYESMRD